MSAPRRIAVITTSRADYGMYRPLLRRLTATPEIDLALIVGGSHLDPAHGKTVNEIETDAFPIAGRVEIPLTSDRPEAVAQAMAAGTSGFARAFARLSPDIVVVLGDRFEMHAAAVAAAPFEIALVHLYGGELSQGSLDDRWRHSVTKLAHLHFVAAQEYRDRVAQMGEEPWRITVCGALALENLESGIATRAELEQRFGLGLETAPLIVTYHPATSDPSATEGEAMIEVLGEFDRPIVISAPNTDAGSRALRTRLDDFAAGRPNVRFVENLGTRGYFGLMAIAAAMVGNSSSGLNEAPAFRLPVVNIGTRQDGRIRAPNVIDAKEDADSIRGALCIALDPKFRESLAGMRHPLRAASPASTIIAARLAEIALDRRLMIKRFNDFAKIEETHGARV